VANRYATVDLGSNNFQMLLADVFETEVRIVDRLKDKVQLLRGFRGGVLAGAAIDRGLNALGRYAELLAALPAERIAVKGTYALRAASNRDEFLRRAQTLLKVPVDVISGREEARLIDVGVSRHLAAEPDSATPHRSTCLVIDIGGGSTEFALSRRAGRSRQLERSTSLGLGCVSLMDTWFSRPELVGTAWTGARKEITDLCATELHGFTGVDIVVGTSGILESILAVCEANGFSEGSISRAALGEIETALTGGLWVADLGLPGLAPERTDIFPAGVAILAAVMDSLLIPEIHFSEATLPLGILYDMLGLEADLDPQDTAVSSLVHRMGLDAEQGERVALRAEALLRSALPDVDARHVTLLKHAARLHEVGLAISPQSFHRHGSYLLQHLNLRGFSADERHALAWLVRGQRRGLPPLKDTGSIGQRFPQLAIALLVLRLAVILERPRNPQLSVPASLVLAGTTLRLSLGQGAKNRPLTHSGLEAEQNLLARQGYRLEF
jgi:exopolyphosphatase/guanosine-5'-triphosphate,3'-diphosphate pyrophosphatase